MEQVIFNLIDNACKYSPPGTPVTVWAALRDGHAVIEVCDQGPGNFHRKTASKVFDMFYRVEDGDSTAGTGLGLAICRVIVEAHGGRISTRQTRHERRRHLHRHALGRGGRQPADGATGRSGRCP